MQQITPRTIRLKYRSVNDIPELERLSKEEKNPIIAEMYHIRAVQLSRYEEYMSSGEWN